MPYKLFEKLQIIECIDLSVDRQISISCVFVCLYMVVLEAESKPKTIKANMNEIIIKYFLSDNENQGSPDLDYGGNNLYQPL